MLPYPLPQLTSGAFAPRSHVARAKARILLEFQAREAHLSAKQDCPQAPAWLPQTHGHQEGPSNHRPPPRARPPEAVGLNAEKAGLSLDRMKIRADFLRAQRGIRHSCIGLGLELVATPENAAREGALRLGITASRKIGGAVERNRAKRRLRAAARAVLPLYGRERHDYVLVARKATLSRAFVSLLDDLTRAAAAAHSALDRKTDGKNA